MTPTPEERKARELLKEYSSLDSERDRAAFVEQVRREFPAAWPNFNGLRAHHRRIEQTDEDEAKARVGTNIDGYKLLALLGIGGMGVVYLAQREGLNVLFALKLLHCRNPSKSFYQRFEIEKEALANLHGRPNFVRIQATGQASDGTPYFVMDYVEGKHLTVYCDDDQLDLAKRLRLFQKVCLAVAEAHEKLIAHRDLKPANILVTRADEPKILDFGIAKLLSGPDIGVPTMTGDLPFTPDYASPEQILGLPMGTPTDIYSLGVVLYELLCGSLPFIDRGFHSERAEKLRRKELKTSPPSSKIAETRRIAAQSTEAPADPRAQAKRAEATAVKRGSQNAAALVRALRGPLDDIVLKAMSVPPEERYSSAKEFASEIDRYFNDEPLVAWKGRSRWVYQSRAFLRRHAPLVAGVAAVVLFETLALFISWRAGAAWKAEGKQQEDLARKSQTKVIELQVDVDRERQLRRQMEEKLRDQRAAQIQRYVNIAIPHLTSDVPSITTALPWLAAAVETAGDDKELARYPRQLLVNALRFTPRLESIFVHGAPLNDFKFDPRGAYVVTAGGSDTKVWDVATRKLWKTLRHPRQAVLRYAAWLPESRVLTAGSDQTVVIWDAAQEAVLFDLPAPAPAAALEEVDVQPDGRFALLKYSLHKGGPPYTRFNVVDLKTGTIESIDIDELPDVCSADLNREGTMIAIGHGSVAEVFKIKPRSVLSRVTHEPAIRDVALSHDGLKLATGGTDATARIWEVGTSHLSRRLDHSSPVTALHFNHADNQLVCRLDALNTSFVWDVQQGKAVNSPLAQSEGRRPNSRITADFRRGVTQYGSDAVAVYDYAVNGTHFAFLVDGKSDSNINFSPNLKYLTASGEPDILWVSPNETTIGLLSQRVGATAFSSDEKTLFAPVLSSGSIAICSLPKADPPTKTIPLDAKSSPVVMSLACRARDSLLAASSSDGIIRFVDPHAGKVVGEIRLEGQTWCPELRFRDDGARLCGTCFDVNRSICVWDVATRQRLHRIFLPKDRISPVGGLRLELTGRRAIGRIGGEQAAVWDLDSEKVIAKLPHHGITTASLAAGGQRAVTGGKGGDVLIWDLTTAEPKIIQRFKMSAGIADLLFSPDSRLVAAAAMQRVAVWSINDSNFFGPLLFHPKAVTAISFAPDSQVLATSWFDDERNTSIVQGWSLANEGTSTKELIRLAQMAGVARVKDDKLLQLNDDDIAQLAAQMPERDLPPASTIAECFRGVVRAQLALNNWPELRDAANGVLKFKPDDVMALWYLGFAQTKLGNPEGARQAFEKLTKLRAGYIQNWTSKGSAELSLGRCKDALESAEAAVKLAAAKKRTALTETDATAWELRGQARANLGRWSDAADDFIQARKISPGIRRFSRQAALALLQANRNKDYVELRSTLLSDPNFKKTEDPNFLWDVIRVSVLSSIPKSERELTLRGSNVILGRYNDYVSEVLAFLDLSWPEPPVGKRVYSIRQAMQQRRQTQTDTIWAWLALAMAEHAQGNTAESLRWYRIGCEWIETEQAKRKANDLKAADWDAIAEGEFLRRQAAAFLQRLPPIVHMSQSDADRKGLQETIVRLSKEIESHPRDAVRLYSRGVARAQLNVLDAKDVLDPKQADWKTVGNDLAESVKFDPHNAIAWYFAALARVAANDLKEYHRLRGEMLKALDNQASSSDLELLLATYGLSPSPLSADELARFSKLLNRHKDAATALCGERLGLCRQIPPNHALIDPIKEIQKRQLGFDNPSHNLLAGLSYLQLGQRNSATVWLNWTILEYQSRRSYLAWFETLRYRILLTEFAALAKATAKPSAAVSPSPKK